MTRASSASQARSCASASSPTMSCRPACRPSCAQRLEGAGIGRPREQLVAVDQIEQRHRLFAQRVDDVTIVDDMAALARRRPAARAAGHASCVEPRKHSSRSS